MVDTLFFLDIKAVKKRRDILYLYSFLAHILLPEMETLRAPNWSERSACEQRSNLGRPLFRYFSFLDPVVKIPEGVVVGFRNFAWAPK